MIDLLQRAAHPRTLRYAFWACVVAILYLALADRPELPSTGGDKTHHLLAFGTLGVLGALAWPHRLASVYAGLVAYGVLIEGLQWFTPSRQADWRDVWADGVGVLLAAAAVAAVRRFRAG